MSDEKKPTSNWSAFCAVAAVVTFGGTFGFYTVMGNRWEHAVVPAFVLALVPVGLALVPLLWRGFLNRTSEVSKAVRGK